MFAIASVEYGEPAAARMQSEVDRKVAEDQLLAGGPQRPLVGKEHGPSRLEARKKARWSGRPGRRGLPPRIKPRGQDRTSSQEDGNSKKRLAVHRFPPAPGEVRRPAERQVGGLPQQSSGRA